MKHQSVTTTSHIIRLERGEEIHVVLQTFARDHDIKGACFSAIGAVKNLTMGYYDLDERKYYLTEYTDIYELVSLTGNLSWKDEIPMTHIHAVLSDTQNQTLGGHIGKMECAVTVEIFLEEFTDYKLTRVMNEEAGLPFLACGE